jgi:hypothetical protein
MQESSEHVNIVWSVYNASQSNTEVANFFPLLLPTENVWNRNDEECVNVNKFQYLWKNVEKNVGIIWISFEYLSVFNIVKVQILKMQSMPRTRYERNLKREDQIINSVESFSFPLSSVKVRAGFCCFSSHFRSSIY